MADPRPLTLADQELARADRLLKVAQAAILLNYSERHVKRLYTAGTLRCRRMRNGAIRIPLAEVHRFIANRTALGDI
jgi:excisionase family DNA binding protein